MNRSINFYKNISSTVDHQPQKYVTVALPIRFTRVIAQLKTASKFITNVTFQKYKPTEECTLCHKN